VRIFFARIAATSMARAWRSRAAALAVALIALLGAVSAFKVRSDSAVPGRARGARRQPLGSAFRARCA